MPRPSSSKGPKPKRNWVRLPPTRSLSPKPPTTPVVELSVVGAKRRRSTTTTPGRLVRVKSMMGNGGDPTPGGRRPPTKNPNPKPTGRHPPRSHPVTPTGGGRLPPEIWWSVIWPYLEAPNPRVAVTNLLTLRSVCREWRDWVDHHQDFRTTWLIEAQGLSRVDGRSLWTFPLGRYWHVPESPPHLPVVTAGGVPVVLGNGAGDPGEEDGWDRREVWNHVPPRPQPRCGCLSGPSPPSYPIPLGWLREFRRESLRVWIDGWFWAVWQWWEDCARTWANNPELGRWLRSVPKPVWECLPRVLVLLPRDNHTPLVTPSTSTTASPPRWRIICRSFLDPSHGWYLRWQGAIDPNAPPRSDDDDDCQPDTSWFDWGAALYRATEGLATRIYGVPGGWAGFGRMDPDTTPPHLNLDLVWGPPDRWHMLPTLLKEFAGYHPNRAPVHRLVACQFLESKLFWLRSLPIWAGGALHLRNPDTNLSHPDGGVYAPLSRGVTREWQREWQDLIRRGRVLVAACPHGPYR